MFRLLLRRRGASSLLQAAGVALWLFSPFTVTISTRGNGEALVACMLLAMLLALNSGKQQCGACCSYCCVGQAPVQCDLRGAVHRGWQSTLEHALSH